MIDPDVFQLMVGKIAQLEGRVSELEAGKPHNARECMDMETNRFEAMVKAGKLPHLSPTDLRAIRIYQHRDECVSNVWITKQNGGEKIRLLRTQEPRIKTMLSRYENGIAPHSQAIVRAMKSVVLHHLDEPPEGERSPISNGVLELRTKNNDIVYRQNRQLIAPDGVPRRTQTRKHQNHTRTWFVGGPKKGESILVFKEHNNFEELEIKYAYLFEFPIITPDDPLSPPITP